MRLPALLLGLFSLGSVGFAGSAQAAAEPGAHLVVGTSPSFIKYIQDATASDTTLARQREILASLRGSYELGFGSLDLHAPVLLNNRDEWPYRMAFNIVAEGAGILSYRDVNLNEIRAAAIYAGILRLAFEGNLLEDLYFETAFVFGAGGERQDRLEDNGTAVARHKRQAVTVLGGLDMKMQKVWRFNNGSRLVSTIGTEETVFRGIKNKDEGNVNWKLEGISHDWLFRNDYLFNRFNVHAIAGKHPYPSKFLPRTWNRIADNASTGTIGSLVGAGGGITAGVGRGIFLAGMAGYYAGGIGGEFRLRSKDQFDLRLSTYNVENSADYRSFNQRIYSLTFDLPL